MCDSKMQILKMCDSKMIKKGGVNKELKSLTVKNTQLLLVVLSN
jgi:hypothetical protein